MRYALTKNNVVTNLIELQQKNASDFPTAVLVNDRPVMAGDTYEDGKFYRDGVEVLTEAERLQQQVATYEIALNTLGVQTEEVLNDAE